MNRHTAQKPHSRPPATVSSTLVRADGEDEDDDAPLSSDAVPRSSAEFLLRVARGSGVSTSLEERAASEDLAWASPRFEILRHLGAGGFGAVYEVLDRKRNARVALKRSTRRHRDADERRRFTQEFRSLADLDHPNLVRLYELHGDDAAWFFTMELVHGQDARSYVRGARATRDGGLPLTSDEARVRAVFRQLAEGLCFLHEAGRVHRDLKPGNVMVCGEDDDARVVILDFGLAFELAEGAAGSVGVAGTPPYMAPEQGRTGPIDAGADWYALGMMLHEALVGRLPFRGSPSEIMRQKQSRDAPGPADVAPLAAVPEDLHRLCLELTRRAPEQRPSGDEVLARLSVTGTSRSARPHDAHDARVARAVAPVRRHEPAFVGRAVELAGLHDALEATRVGAAVVLVHAASGMGKTALVGRFLEELGAREPGLVVLRGRCFEQESIPDKTLEGVIDGLARHLARMSAPVIAEIAPDDGPALSRVFPALGQVPGWRAPPGSPDGDTADKLGVRRRAIAALRQVMVRLAERVRLVAFIDDLQWGDADGGALLAELLRPPGAPAMLVVGTYRTEEAERSDALRALLPALRSAPTIDCREIALGPLSDEEAYALARSTLDAHAPHAPHPSPSSHAEASRWLRVGSESGGSPFFLVELCRFSADEARRGARPEQAISLSAMLSARVAALPPGARRALDVLAVAGQPIDRGVLAKASGLADHEPTAVAVLRARSLLRSGGPDDALETYHDHVRAAVLAALAPDAKRRHHAALAEALAVHFAQGAKPDFELLAAHSQGAGESATASGYWEAAADAAQGSLDFERAVRLYRQALVASETDASARAIPARPDAPRRRTLHERLGGALGNTGRGRPAAEAYMAAADGALPEAKLAMHLLAAEHYLRSGHLDEGFAVLRSVLDATGVSLPATAAGAMGQALALMALLQVRGVGPRARGLPAELVWPIVGPPGDAASDGARVARERARIDAWSAAARGLLYADPPRALYCHMRGVWLALSSGDDDRLLRELVIHHCFRASLRGEGPTPAFEAGVERRIAELLEALRGAGPRLQAATGLVESGRGIVQAFGARYGGAREHLERAEAELSACPIRVGHDLTLARVWLVTALYGLGEWRELARRQPIFLAEARACGDRFAEVELAPFTGLLALMSDRPDAAQAVLESLEAWRRDQPRSVSFNAVVATMLYRDWGQGEVAWRATPKMWKTPGLWLAVRSSKTVGVYHAYHCAAAELAAAATAHGARRARRLGGVERTTRGLARLDTPFSRAAAAALRAGAAACRGDVDGASVLVAEAERGFGALEMKHYAAAARHRRGELVGGDQGRDLVESAAAAMRAEGIASPARMTAALLPGRW